MFIYLFFQIKVSIELWVKNRDTNQIVSLVYRYSPVFHTTKENGWKTKPCLIHQCTKKEKQTCSKQSELKRSKRAGSSSDTVANSKKQKATQSCRLTCPVWPEAAL